MKKIILLSTLSVLLCSAPGYTGGVTEAAPRVQPVLQQPLVLPAEPSAVPHQ